MLCRVFDLLSRSMFSWMLMGRVITHIRHFCNSSEYSRDIYLAIRRFECDVVQSTPHVVVCFVSSSIAPGLLVCTARAIRQAVCVFGDSWW